MVCWRELVFEIEILLERKKFRHHIPWLVLSNLGSQRLIIFHFEIINYTLMIRGFSEKIMIGIRSLFYSFSKSIFKFTCNSFVENLINYSLFIDIRTWISIQCILFIFCWKWTSQVNIRRVVTLIEVLQLSFTYQKIWKIKAWTDRTSRSLRNNFIMFQFKDKRQLE